MKAIMTSFGITEDQPITHKMLSKNIMKLTRRYNGQVIVDYHFISNSGQMYAAFSPKLLDYEV